MKSEKQSKRKMRRKRKVNNCVVVHVHFTNMQKFYAMSNLLGPIGSSSKIFSNSAVRTPGTIRNFFATSPGRLDTLKVLISTCIHEMVQLVLS